MEYKGLMLQHIQEMKSKLAIFRAHQKKKKKMSGSMTDLTAIKAMTVLQTSSFVSTTRNTNKKGDGPPNQIK